MKLTLEELKSIIVADEHRNLELKKTTGELNVGMHTACAFLNTDGGWLVFGVSPKSLKIIGQQVTDNTQREIAAALAGIQPNVDVRVNYLSLNGEEGSPNSNGADDNKLIAMYFPPFQTGCRPYTFHGCPYYRVESTTREMPREMFDERLRQSNPYLFAWERQPAEGFGIDDISEERLRGALRLGVGSGRMVPSVETEPVEVLLNKLRLLTSDGRPNNAAALLFGNQATCCPQFKLRMARFHGEGKSTFDDLQMVEGNFFDLLDAGMAFFVKHLPIKADVVGFRREEQLEIPATALREALVNALCHRQWERYNLSVGIAVYDDRIEIENPGLFPPPITPTNIKQPHLSYPYNSIVADVLYKTTYLEQWGSGVQRILQACRQQNVRDPEWELHGGFVTVTFYRKNTVVSDNPLDNPLDNSLDNPLDNPLDNLSEKQRMVLRLMKEDRYITASALAEKIGVSRNMVNRINAQLKQKGLISREGGNRMGRWVVHL